MASKFWAECIRHFWFEKSDYNAYDTQANMAYCPLRYHQNAISHTFNV